MKTTDSVDRNLYRDTEQRLLHDSEFRALVEQLARAATRLGLTPGEIKQVAFAAAVLIESRHPFLFQRTI